VVVSSDDSRNHVFDEGPDPPEKGQFWGKGCPLESIGMFCYELCKNGRTDRFAVWVVDLGGRGPKKVQVQSYSLGGANVSLRKSTLAPPCEYD